VLKPELQTVKGSSPDGATKYFFLTRDVKNHQDSEYRFLFVCSYEHSRENISQRWRNFGSTHLLWEKGGRETLGTGKWLQIVP